VAEDTARGLPLDERSEVSNH